MKLSPNAPCPCGRDAKLKHCCARYHKGRPASPPALVRSRYTAYVLANTRYLIETTHPTGPHFNEDRRQWKTQLQDYCRRATFHGLQIHDHTIDESQGRAQVTFTVDIRHDGHPAGFTERSTFLRDGNRWRYLDGEFDPSV